MSFGGDIYRAKAGTGNITDEKLSKNAVCSLIIHGFWEITSSCVMAHQDDLLNMFELLYQRQGASSTFSKARSHSSLPWTRYT